MIDAFILAPVVLALYTTLGFRWSVQLVCASITLTYFFVLEAQSGQTLGKRLMRLRVMHIDGGPARAAAIGGRTALRVIDWHLGLFVMVLTGRRRQRIGDLATGTVVRADDRPYVPAPRSPLTTIYPAVWMGTALIAAWQFGLFHPPHGSWVQRTSDPYMARIDQICKQRVQRERPLEGTETVEQVQRYSVAETRAIEQLPPPPPRSRRAYRETLKWKHRLDALGSRVLADVAASSNPQATLDAEIGRLKDLGTVANQRFLELGLPHCAQ